MVQPNAYHEYTHMYLGKFGLHWWKMHEMQYWIISALFHPHRVGVLLLPGGHFQGSHPLLLLLLLLLLLFSGSVVSKSLWPHGLQHARPPCPLPSPGVCSTHVHWVGDAIQPSHPLSSPSPPAISLSQHQGFFQWVNTLYGDQQIPTFSSGSTELTRFPFLSFVSVHCSPEGTRAATLG